ncbi:hypothetical protein LEP1GSC058_0873 [Leptospira fainei serovar Hurstbridge str. BUT 6]|uniref:Uncharacterized protein n=1 Tax=Leptospira fainei serovar Hurstbridge str. BUT 6 TaxID=1193011 RepID=S3UQK8_9LEPT|nr:hypothetical protein LEP1GSC058_0873 [Leptospira fainei serovar Hurstbridge str. BUT 6]
MNSRTDHLKEERIVTDLDSKLIGIIKRQFLIMETRQLTRIVK